MDRLDEMAAILRDTAAELESLRAAATSTLARIATLESLVAESSAAQARTAEDLERVRGELVRISVLERSLTQLSEERQRQIDQVASELRSALADTSQRLDVQVQQVGRELAPFNDRIRALETLPDQLAALGHQRTALAEAVNNLSSRLDEAVAQRQGLEETARQREAREHAHISELQRQIAGLEQSVATWQTRIEAQSGILHEARAIAEGMVGEIQTVQRSQHEGAEAQRVWETRLEATLAQRQADSDETWRAFLVERAHDWQRIEERQAAVEDRLRALDSRIEAILAQLQAHQDENKAAAESHGAALLAMRREIVGIVGGLRDRLGDAIGELESGLPYTERPSVVEDRRLALRREVRARRGARKD